MARNTPVLTKLIKKYTSGNIDLPIMFFDKLLENFEQNMIHQKAFSNSSINKVAMVKNAFLLMSL